MNRRFMLSGTMNTRDLGGYPIHEGGYTAWGRFLRSDLPATVTEEDIRRLLDAKITTVVDLRSLAELAEKPCALAAIPGFYYHHNEMHIGSALPPETPDLVAGSYMAMAEAGENMARVMRAIAGAPGGVLFHCRAGKDRTGVVAALLLLLAGAPPADICADYVLTGAYLEPLFLALAKQYENFPMNVVVPRLDYMRDFLNLFLEKNGSVQDYLSAIGLTEEEIKILQEKMTRVPHEVRL